MSWEKVKLGDICDFINGGAWSDKEYVSLGIPVLKVSNFKPSGFFIDDINYLPPDSAEKYEKNKLLLNDVIIATVGSHPNLQDSAAGRSCVVNSLVTGFYLNQNAVCVRTKNNDVLEQRYLGFLAKTQDFLHYIQSRGRGAANQMRIAIGAIKEYEFVLPPMAIQRRIADIPGHEHTKIVDGVPEGWRYGHITDISECFDSKRKPLSSTERDRQQKKFPYYGAASLMDYVEDYIFDGIYLLFGEDGTVITSEGTPVLQYVWGKFWVNNHAHIFQGLGQYSTEFLYMLCKYMNVNDVVTGVAQPKISRGRLNEKNILIPAEKYIRKYSAIVEKWFYKLRGLKTENELLLEARDRLLPKLMSGEVEV